MKITAPLILCIFFGFTKLSAIENHFSGARPLALSNAFVSISDTWSTFHNQAGMAGLQTISAGFFYESKFMIEELSLAAGSFALPVNTGTFGISFSQFGKATYKENKVGLAFSKQISAQFYAGIQIDYFSHTFPENDGAKGFSTFEAGIIYNPKKSLFLGAHIFNPISAGIETPAGKQKMPVTFRLGGHYNFSENLLIIFESQKNDKAPFIVKTGIEFSPAQNLFLRFGVSGKPINYTSGIGYRIGKLVTDIAFSYHGILGITPSVSVQIEL